MSYYTKTGNPANNTRGLSTTVRAEFAAIESGFTQAESAIAGKAALASPAFTGTPTAPTAGSGVATAQIATAAFVQQEIAMASLNGVAVAIPVGSTVLLPPSFSNTYVDGAATFLRSGVVSNKTTYPNAPTFGNLSYTTLTNPAASTGGRGSSNGTTFVLGNASANGNIETYNESTGTRTTQSLPASMYGPVAYGSGIFVLAATGGTAGATSPTGATWSAMTLPAAMADIAHNGTNFCCVTNASSNTAYYSPTGLTGSWVPGTLPSTTTWSRVLSNGSTFLAVDFGTTTGATSPTGATWTSNTLPISPDGASAANGRFFIWSATDLRHSADATTWTTATLPSSGVYAILYSNGVYILHGNSTTYLSSDLVTWTQQIDCSGDTSIAGTSKILRYQGSQARLMTYDASGYIGLFTNTTASVGAAAVGGAQTYHYYMRVA